MDNVDLNYIHRHLQLAQAGDIRSAFDILALIPCESFYPKVARSHTNWWECDLGWHYGERIFGWATNPAGAIAQAGARWYVLYQQRAQEEGRDGR